MKNIWKTAILSCAVLMAGFMACDDAPLGKDPGTVAYVNESSTGKAVAPVTITENGASAQITICVNKAAKSELRFRLRPDQEVLDEYNVKQSSDYVLLPDEMLEEFPEVVILAGKYDSEPVKIIIKPKPANIPADIFALALQLESVDGLCSVAPATSTYVLPMVTINSYSLPLFYNTRTSGTAPNAAGGPDLVADWYVASYDNFTIEYRYQVSSFGTGAAALPVFENRGSEGDVYLVHWDTPSPNPDGYPAASRLQVDHKNKAGFYYQPTSIGLWTNVWNHIAVVYDGSYSTLYYNGVQVAQYESDNVGREFDGARWFFYGNNSTVRSIRVLCTEMRIWSVARTSTQIMNNMTTVSPRAAGLEAYWDMTRETYEMVDDIHTWADRTGNGHTLRMVNTVALDKWIDDIKSSDATTPW
ncbi:MAG: DUF1735 and LamG domain-containing protein [Alistipes sp.]|nr:DUF1735 and LamG domain-containing protein [Alistipes sp.]